ncbi:MAG: OmpA family protein [Desulfobacterales bacterium]|nr:OmpA family protein [Desulfobacterales bacterium]
MKSRKWMNLVMVALVAGLFLTVSCAKKTVVSDETTIEDQAQAAKEAEAAEKARKEAEMEAERIKQQKIDEEMAKKKAMQAAMEQAKKDFVDKDILFAFDSSELDASAIVTLREKAAWLRANPSAVVTIEGHCDERGTTEYNLALGERRATTVKAYLVNLGIDASQLKTISYGEEQATGSDEAGYRLDRRAHFVIN